ncbi:MAG: hypothetical protein M3Y21_00825 [Candidatus Eremiobacteraeota bacterium]|nr:hypothetical protein [Candidatus Eremiobacteraeota bacterium]
MIYVNAAHRSALSVILGILLLSFLGCNQHEKMSPAIGRMIPSATLARESIDCRALEPIQGIVEKTDIKARFNSSLKASGLARYYARKFSRCDLKRSEANAHARASNAVASYELYMLAAHYDENSCSRYIRDIKLAQMVLRSPTVQASAFRHVALSELRSSIGDIADEKRLHSECASPRR